MFVLCDEMMLSLEEKECHHLLYSGRSHDHVFDIYVAQEKMYSMILVEEHGITALCSKAFGDMFFSSAEFDRRLNDLRHLTFYIWGR